MGNKRLIPLVSLKSFVRFELVPKFIAGKLSEKSCLSMENEYKKLLEIDANYKQANLGHCLAINK